MLEKISITYYLFGILLVLVSYFYWFFYDHFKYWERRNVSTLKPIIPFGNALSVLVGKVTFGEFLSNIYLELRAQGAKHGGLYMFAKPIYIPTDLDVIKKILISDADKFPNHGMYSSPKDDPLSAYLFNLDDAKWRNLRSKTPAAFTAAKMKQMFLVMERLSETYIKILDSYAQSGRVIDIKSEVTRLALDTISACAFGMESRTMENKNEDLIIHGRSFFDYQFHLIRNAIVMLVPRDVLRKLKFRVTTREAEKYILNMFGSIIKFRKENNIVKDDLANIFMKLTEKSEDEKDITEKGTIEPLNINELAAHMYFFLSAGFETSSSLQTFALYELTKNPQCQIKLREEINTVLKRYGNKLSYDAVMEMKYLDQVLDEALRLYPVFPIVLRICKADYEIPEDGVKIEKGTYVVMTNMGIQRDPEYYPDPLVFDPDRFSTENKSKRPGITHLPFGEGPRICVGKRFGLLQSKLGLISIIRNFEVTLNEKTTSDFKFVHMELMLRKEGDIWLNLKRITQ